MISVVVFLLIEINTFKMPFTPPFPAEVEDNHSLAINPTSPLYTFKPSLPALYISNGTDFRIPDAHPIEFYQADMSVSRLNNIHDSLWLAGKPEPARPLHRQKMLRRNITITEQADLHLVWDGPRILIKPLPRYLLTPTFWTETRMNKELQETALGFLRSYSWLVRHESDFIIATELHLVPPELKWAHWKKLIVECYQKDPPVMVSARVNKRYCFGELRQARLNHIYRFRRGNFIRGYEFGYNLYGSFFSRNFAWLITVFVYVTIALTAMQVGLATDSLGHNAAFQQASYGFGIFSLLLPVLIVCVALGIFLVNFVNNFLHTKKIMKERKATGYLV